MHKPFLVTILLLAFGASETTIQAEWPQWGGVKRDFVVREFELAEGWPAAGPAVLWQRDLGPGYSAIVARGDRLVTMYRRDDHEVVVALSRSSGQTLWEHPYRAPVGKKDVELDTTWGTGPNATPLIADGRVYTLGFTGQLRCLSLEDGKPVWSHDLTEEYGVEIPYFGHSSSPLRHRDTILVVAGGVFAFGLEDGKLRWRNEKFDGSYASAVLLTRDERTILVVPAAGEVVGLDADDGELLWRHEHANVHRTILSSPVHGDDAWIFVSAYFLGSIGLQVDPQGAAVTEVWETPHLQLSQSNAVRAGDFVYGSHNSILTAMNIRTGEIAWRHRGFKKANLVRAGDRFLLLDALGKLALVSLTPQGITVHDEAQILRGRSWTVPTLDGRQLYVRNQETLLALDLAARSQQPDRRTQRTRPALDVDPELRRSFLAAKRRLSEAYYRADSEALTASRDEFATWQDTPVAPLAHYYSGFAALQQVRAARDDDATRFVDLAIDHLEQAVSLDKEFADAHALLGRVYPLLYRFDPERAAVAGPLGDEHISIALLLAAQNPRVVAAQATDLFYSPPDHGGDREAGLEGLRRALELFEHGPRENSRLEPDEGHAATWVSYGQALLRLAEPDRDEARRAFREALKLQPDFARARSLLAEIED